MAQAIGIVLITLLVFGGAVVGVRRASSRRQQLIAAMPLRLDMLPMAPTIDAKLDDVDRALARTYRSAEANHRLTAELDKIFEEIHRVDAAADHPRTT